MIIKTTVAMRFLSQLKQNLNRYDYAAIALAFLFFIIRVFTLQPHAFSITTDLDAHRDYLIAYNILHYRDFPAVGPPMSFFGLTSNSPIYYYLLAFLLWIHDSFHFLQVVNVMLQAANLFIIYLLGKKLFSAKTGLLAITLVAVSTMMYVATDVFWQPYWMWPVLNLSFLLLYESYEKKSFRYLMGSVVAFWLAAVLHGSAYAVAPLFVFFVCYWFSKNRTKHQKWYIFLLAVVSLALWIGAYLPVFIYFTANHITNASSAITHGWVGSLPQYFGSLGIAIRLLFQVLLPGEGYWLAAILLLGATITGSYRGYSKNLLIVAIFTLQIAILFAFSTSGRLIGYYFLPAFTGLALLVSATVTEAIRTPHKKISLLLKVCLILALLYFASPTLSSLGSNATIARAETSDSQAIYTSILSQAQQLQNENHYPDYHFFNILGFTTDSVNQPGEPGPFLAVNYDVYYWPQLEATFNEQLVHTDQISPIRDYGGNDHPDVWFVICYGKNADWRDYCVEAFNYHYSGFSNVTTLQDTSDYSLFEFEK